MLGHGQQPIPVTDVAGSCREMPLQEWGGILVKLATSSTHLVKASPFHSNTFCACRPPDRHIMPDVTLSCFTHTIHP